MVLGEEDVWQGWERLSPLLRYANFYDAEPEGDFGPRYIQDFQLLIVQSGQGSAQVEGERFSLTAGDVLFYGPNVRHAVQSSRSDPLHLIGLHFLFCQSDLTRINPRLPHGLAEPFVYPNGSPCCPLHPPPPAKISPHFMNEIRVHCESLVLSYIAAPTGRQMEKRGLLMLAFEAWHDAVQRVDQGVALPESYGRAISQAQEAILQNLAYPPTPAHLARTTGLHPDYFTRLFKRHTGMSVRGFVTQQRLLQARRLLVEGHLNVSDVAYRLGFNDPYYFSRLFTQRFGVAPSIFRKEHALL